MPPSTCTLETIKRRGAKPTLKIQKVAVVVVICTKLSHTSFTAASLGQYKPTLGQYKASQFASNRMQAQPGSRVGYTSKTAQLAADQGKVD